jgi:5'-3' exonuclease
MIIVDTNQVIISNIMAQTYNSPGFEEDLIRHIFLNSIKYFRKTFKDEFGELVLAFDGPNSWRKDAFPYYKANRKKAQDKSVFDWNELFTILNKIREEIKFNFPYKVVHLDRTEADDIIAVLSKTTKDDRVLIISGDKDFVQLQNHFVKQYDPVRKQWVESNDPAAFLVEHILKGDAVDGIPNILSPDNCLVIGQRQKPMTKKRLAELKKSIPDDLKKNFDS